MPIYDSKSSEAKTLEGVHLYHFVFSNCSQRVRIALCEKNIDWISHHLDLSKNEHITPEYQALNPKGVVPTLVNDGEVVVESNDIITYLNERFPEPPLISDKEPDRVFMEFFLKMASEAQGHIKVLSFDRLFRGLLNVDKAELGFLERNRNNDEIVQFMEDYGENGEAWELRVKEAGSRVDGYLQRIEKGLGDRPWLSGSIYGLADISWVVNVHRIKTIGLSFDDYPALVSWYQQCVNRPAFERAVTKYAP